MTLSECREIERQLERNIDTLTFLVGREDGPVSSITLYMDGEMMQVVCDGKYIERLIVENIKVLKRAMRECIINLYENLGEEENETERIRKID